VYDLTQPLETAFAAPVASFPFREGIMALEWSPDESSFATYSVDGAKDAAGKLVWRIKVNVCDLATSSWSTPVEWLLPSFAQGFELFIFNGRVLSWGG
jgi:hypothetical protein